MVSVELKERMKELTSSYGYSWREGLDVQEYRSWGIFLRAVKFHFLTNEGVGRMVLKASGELVFFEHYVTEGSEGTMIPLWLAYPGYSSVTSGWRQGEGENYRRCWSSWYEALSDEQKASYQERFEAPDDERGWVDFYKPA